MTITKLIEGLEIHKRYCKPYCVSAEHDMICAGEDPSVYSVADRAKLLGDGWSELEVDGTWTAFV